MRAGVALPWESRPNPTDTHKDAAEIRDFDSTFAIRSGMARSKSTRLAIEGQNRLVVSGNFAGSRSSSSDRSGTAALSKRWRAGIGTFPSAL